MKRLKKNMTNFELITSAPYCLLKNHEWLMDHYHNIADRINWEEWLKSEVGKKPSDFVINAQRGFYSDEEGKKEVECMILGKCEMFGQDYIRLTTELDDRWTILSVPAYKVRITG